MPLSSEDIALFLPVIKLLHRAGVEDWFNTHLGYLCDREHSCIKYDGYCMSNALIDYVEIYL